MQGRVPLELSIEERSERLFPSVMISETGIMTTRRFVRCSATAASGNEDDVALARFKIEKMENLRDWFDAAVVD